MLQILNTTLVSPHRTASNLSDRPQEKTTCLIYNSSRILIKGKGKEKKLNQSKIPTTYSKLGAF